MAQEPGKERTFRDRIGIVSEEGKRVWVYARRPDGILFSYRLFVSFLLIAVFFILPFIKVNETPLFLIDILSRKFILFGKIFWPQDFFLFFLLMISFIVFIILFTVIYGRIWCGWGCPQSVFMEIVFRNIEWLIEGNPQQQKKLNENGFSFEYFIKKIIKHFLFWLLSFFIAVTILSYISGYESIFAIVTGGFALSGGKFTGVLIFATVIYIIFSQIRELVCTILCPYGRLQGVLLDRNSINVAYDFIRGEPRGKLNEENKGDCIDCANCLHVCPSGIDIRNGIQLECTNCTACIDACNSVMKRIHKPKGLIRYASLNNIEKSEKLKFSARVAGYSAVLCLLLVFLSYLLISRTDIQTTILRTPGTIFQEQPDGRISNLYSVKIQNKTHHVQDISIKLLSPPSGEIKLISNNGFHIKDQSSSEAVFFVILDKSYIKSADMPVELGIFANNILTEKKNINFKSQN